MNYICEAEIPRVRSDVRRRDQSQSQCSFLALEIFSPMTIDGIILWATLLSPQTVYINENVSISRTSRNTIKGYQLRYITDSQ